MENKLFYYELIGKSFLKEFNIDVKITYKDIKRGFSAKKGYISIPLWSLTYGKEYAIYYILHEIIHQIIYRDYKTFGHGKEFKTLERELLARFQIVIEYKKAYAEKLYFKGNLVFNNFNK